jgi:hypothetical protein
MEIKTTCPLGSQCEEIKDNQMHRCAWYTKLVGKNPNTGEDVDDWSCAIAFMPMLQIEMANTNRGQTAALESFRNETVSGQAQFNEIMSQATNRLEN